MSKTMETSEFFDRTKVIVSKFFLSLLIGSVCWFRQSAILLGLIRFWHICELLDVCVVHTLDTNPFQHI